MVIAGRRVRRGVADEALATNAARLSRQMETGAALKPADASRSPYFCSGCPHNTGTRFPEGSIAAGGIGCHAMAMYSGPEMLPNTQMGGEGAHWSSLAYFSDMNHLFQKMGAGT